MNLIFLGPPGVGKGTHAMHVSEYYGIPKISTGEIFREEIKKESEIGKKVKGYLEKGVLVPNEITIKILKKRLEKPDCKKGFILDGFPRNLEQANALEKITKIDLVVNFVLSRDVILKRITNRLTCSKCQRVYNKIFDPPKVNGYCDVCGGKLYVREDQKPEIVNKRLDIYEKETKPLIEYYKKKGILIDFNCDGTVEEVRKRIINLLKKYFKQ